jgi:hypothetical protein
MPGLLDARGGFNDPITMGLLGASQALLTPMSQGGGLGAAFGAFPAAQQAALKNKYLQQQMEGQEMEGKLRQMQLIASMKKMDDEARAQDYMTRRMGGWNPSSGAALSAEAQTGGQLGPTNAAAGRLQTGGGGQKFPFSVDEVTMLTRMGMPGLWDQYKFFNTQENIPAGSLSVNRNTNATTHVPNLEKGMQLNPDGSVSNAAGFLSASAAQLLSQKKTEAPFQAPVTIDLPNGQKKTIPFNQFLELTGAFDPPKVGGQSGVAPGAATPPAAFPQGPQLGGLVSGEPNADRDRRVAAAKNSELMNVDWMKRYAKIVEEGDSAGKSITDMQLLRGMDFNTGIGVEKQAQVANLLRSVHPSFEQYAAKAEKFGTIATDTTLQKQLEQAGVATKSDTELAAKVGPSIAKTPEANAFAIDYIEAVARVKEQKARYYQMMRTAAQESGEANLTAIDKRWADLQRKTPALSVFGQPTMQRWAPQR